MPADFVNYIRSSNPLLLVRTYEEFRALNRFITQLSQVKKKSDKTPAYQTYVWSLHGGIRLAEIVDGKLRIGNTAIEGTEKNPPAALTWMEKTAPDNTVLFLRDYHPYMTEKYEKGQSIIAKIRDLVRTFNAQNKALVFISPAMQIPSDLEKDITPVEFKLPDKAELLTVLKGVCLATGARMPKEAEVDAILDAALGMTSVEAENAFSLSLVEAKKFDPALIRREKAVIVKKSGILEVIETLESLDTIGGLENAKAWALIKKECFTPEARAFGASSPKGILLMGIPGCGKSLLAKALSTAFGRPLLRLDFSSIMDKWVGGSEGKMKLCLDTAEAVSPSILWIW